MSHYTFARCGSLEVIWGSIDLAYLLPVLAARGTKMNSMAPRFLGAHILAWRTAMEINNYKTRLACSQRCMRPEDKADMGRSQGRLHGGGEVCIGFGAAVGRGHGMAQYMCLNLPARVKTLGRQALVLYSSVGPTTPGTGLRANAVVRAWDPEPRRLGLHPSLGEVRQVHVNPFGL